MELSEFIKKYAGRKVDYDGVYGAQCVDLFRQYYTDVLGIKQHTGSVIGAKDLYLNYSKLPIEQKYFKRICKSRPLMQGDVLVWDKTEKNQYGHVAIFICKVNEDLLVFEQNGITQAGAELVIRTKDNLLGALRRR